MKQGHYRELGACGYISGLLSFLMALSFLNEKVSWQFVAAIACVIAGTILMFQRKSLIKKSDH